MIVFKLQHNIEMDATDVQHQVEERWLRNLRRDIRDIVHLRYIRITPSRPPPDIHIVEGDIGDCTICQELFILGEKFVVLPCNPTHPHRFHKNCIEPWLRGHDTCPTCRGKV